MVDGYTKSVLTIIAICLVVIAAKDSDSSGSATNRVYVVGGSMGVHVEGGKLDYETDVSGGPTLKICTQC